MPQIFNTIGLIGKFGDPGIGATISALAAYLHEQGREVVLDESTAAVVPDHGLPTASRRRIGESCELVIIIGGDGTLLNAARSLADCDVALLGVNLGRLGFLVDISPADMTTRLGEILDGEFQEEERLLLHTTVIHEGETLSESEALNDVVIHKWEVARMIETETYIDGRYVATVRSDGLIVSTPTGSTAYALSGGGPILQPTLDAMVLVPICPHTMSNRPIVFAADSEIEIVVSDAPHARAQVTCDGQINLGLVSGDSIRIRRHPRCVRLIHPKHHDHFEILRAKLRWGTHP